MNINSGSLKAYARQKLSGHWGLAVIVSLVSTILGGNGGSVGGAGGSASNNSNNSNNSLYDIVQEIPESIQVVIGVIIVVAAIWALIVFFIGPAVELGQKSFYLKLCRESPVSFADLFSKFSCFWKAFGLRFMMGLFIFLWSLLLIIPGIIAGYRYAMAMYILTERPETGIMDAISESKKVMDGHKMNLFILDLSFLGWILLSILTLGIGLLFVVPYMEAARTAFYLRISGNAEAN